MLDGTIHPHDTRYTIDMMMLLTFRLRLLLALILCPHNYIELIVMLILNNLIELRVVNYELALDAREDEAGIVC